MVGLLEHASLGHGLGHPPLEGSKYLWWNLNLGIGIAAAGPLVWEKKPLQGPGVRSCPRDNRNTGNHLSQELRDERQGH